MKNDFVVTSQVKNYIYFDAINNQFKVPKRKLKYLLQKTEIHKFNEIEKIKLLELEDEKYCFIFRICAKCNENIEFIYK